MKQELGIVKRIFSASYLVLSIIYHFLATNEFLNCALIRHVDIEVKNLKKSKLISLVSKKTRTYSLLQLAILNAKLFYDNLIKIKLSHIESSQ